MVNLIPDLVGISALLHGDLGGVVLDILFLGTLLFWLQLDSFYLLRKVTLRYGNKKINCSFYF